MHSRFSREAHRSLRRRYELKKTLRAYLFLAPFLIFFAAFLFLPVAFLFWLTFHAEGILAPPTFVGLTNWRRSFADPLVLKTIANTLLYCLMAIPAVFVLAMVLALALRSIQRGRTLIRTLIYLPTLQPSLVVALIWTFVLHPDFGILNVIARAAIGRPINFLGEPSNALATIAMVEVWRGFGFWSVLFLSGLMALPIELYYAAELEGAGPVRRFFVLTLPLLKPIFYFSVIFATIVNLQLFDSVFALTDGGPA
ncbi:MAG: sugar ABC transporter permease, partial [Methylobacteriaceae bacterium]|nr:sugar ABC transporter permease [Methylobacteriaceae bacterium]